MPTIEELAQVKEMKLRVGKNLEYLRTLKGLTKYQLAKSLKFNTYYISSSEKGTRAQTFKALVRFSNFYGIAVGTLIDYDLENNPHLCTRLRADQSLDSSQL